MTSTCNHCGGTEARALFTLKGYDLVACKGCDLAYVANPPSAEELSRIYSDAADYHAELKLPGSVVWRRMDKIADGHIDFMRLLPGGGKLLDVGCSTGQFLVKARDTGFEVAGIEFSEGSAGFAAEYFGLAVQQGSIHDCTLPTGSLDMLTMFDVIEHVPDPASDIAKAWSLLKPGGWFVLSTPNIDGLFPRLSFKLAKTLNYWPHPEPPYHLYQFSVRTLSAMLTKAGFETGPVRHDKMELAYTFGNLKTLARMPKRLVYALAFAPIDLLGPLIGQGDWFYIAARKPA
jgi:2-polyprenyl-3-methyl-5-hydroxy-6-metoxy-1,4-benzoquinol methylase